MRINSECLSEYMLLFSAIFFLQCPYLLVMVLLSSCAIAEMKRVAAVSNMGKVSFSDLLATWRNTFDTLLKKYIFYTITEIHLIYCKRKIHLIERHLLDTGKVVYLLPPAAVLAHLRNHPHGDRRRPLGKPSLKNGREVLPSYSEISKLKIFHF